MTDEYDNVDDDGNFLEEEDPRNGEGIVADKAIQYSE